MSALDMQGIKDALWNDLSDDERLGLNNFLSLIKKSQADGLAEWYQDGLMEYGYTGVHFPCMSPGVFYGTEQNGIESTLTIMQSKFAGKGAPLTYIWPHSTEVPEVVAALLAEKGYTSTGKFYGVMADLTGPLPEPKPCSNLHIQNISGPEAFEAFMEVFGKAFGREHAEYVRGQFRQFLEAIYQKKGVSFYVAHLDGQPAGCLTAIIDDDLLGLYNFGTDPAFGRRGVGDNLWRHALLEAINVGCTRLVVQLMADAQAAKIAQKYGGRAISTFEPFFAPQVG